MSTLFTRPAILGLAGLLLCACANDGRTTGEHVDAAIETTGKAVQTAGELTIEGMRKVDRAISDAIETDNAKCRAEEDNADC